MSEEAKKTKGLMKLKQGMLELFGMFAKRTYWWDLVKKMTQEAISAFIFACANTVKEMVVPSGSTYNNTNNASKGFGGGFAPTSGYAPSATYPTRDSGGDQRFPGFGQR